LRERGVPAVNWLVVSASDADFRRAGSEDWLCPEERECLAKLEVPKRREDWLLGRATAKRLVQAWLLRRGLRRPLHRIAVEAGPDGAPRARLTDGPSGVLRNLSLSLSHSNGLALGAIVEGRGLTIGADIERVEPRSAKFQSLFFTASESQAVRRVGVLQRAALATAVWSVKESVLKAFRVGLRADTRDVCCRLGEAATRWRRFRADCSPAVGAFPVRPSDALDALREVVPGWWRVFRQAAGGEFVLALAVRRERVRFAGR
jgi:4'-phosphopantetheinyl transferase